MIEVIFSLFEMIELGRGRAANLSLSNDFFQEFSLADLKWLNSWSSNELG